MTNPTKSNLIIAGVDDATKCPCIGSIFVAGVVAEPKIIQKWRKLGVQDSKCLTRKKRAQLSQMIEQTALSHTVQEITPCMIDDKSINLNAWEMITLVQILHHLQTKIPIAYALIDNWEVSSILFWERLRSILEPELAQLVGKINRTALSSIQMIPEHQADERHVIVGAASILAKNASDLQYDQYRETYGDFGSGNPGDQKTRRFLWQHRQNPPPIVRTSWSTFKTISQLKTFE